MVSIKNHLVQFTDIVKSVLICFMPEEEHIGTTLTLECGETDMEIYVDSMTVAFVKELELNASQMKMSWESTEGIKCPIEITGYNNEERVLCDWSEKTLLLPPKTFEGWIFGSANNGKDSTNLFNTGASPLLITVRVYSIDKLEVHEEVLEKGGSYKFEHPDAVSIALRCTPNNTDVYNKLVIL